MANYTDRRGKKKQNVTSERHDKVINFIYNSIIEGATTSNLVNNLMNDVYEVGYKYGKDRAYSLITEARRIIRDDYAEDRKQLKEDLYAKLVDVYAECREQNDRANAIKALQEIGKVTGCNEQNVNIQGNIDKNITINFGFEDNNEN